MASREAKKQKHSTKAKPFMSWMGRHKALVVLLALILCWLAFDLSPFGGNIRFYSAWVECGDRPVATAGSGYLNDGAIHYYAPPKVALTRPSIEYFCTPLEAEEAGYSASSEYYDFPHLEQGGRR